jgi:hypothetical protein
MFTTLKALILNKSYSLIAVFNRLKETNQFEGDLATFITIVWQNKNFVISMPHDQPVETFTITRISDYE